MPGVKSLLENQYYAHPQNQFWKIMGELFGARRELAYEERLKELVKNHVALWDVVYRCQREGSLDSAIKSDTVEANDFEQLFSLAPQIRTIYFNGQKAEQLFTRLAFRSISILPTKPNLVRLPSTSPAHATISKEEKMKVWCTVLKKSVK